jgi:hypothetical protein
MKITAVRPFLMPAVARNPTAEGMRWRRSGFRE